MNTASPLQIAVLPGDGIGPEVTAEAVRVLERVGERFEIDFALRDALIGGAAVDAVGDPLPVETLELCHRSDAVLLGAVGGPRWSAGDPAARPEAGLLRLRQELEVFANLRPVRPYPQLAAASPLKSALLDGVDMMFVRELTGGLYFGPRTADATSATDTCVYTVPEIERVTRVAADLARARGGRLTSIDKANVLATSRLWRATVERLVAEEYPDVELDHRYVDAAAMQIITSPADFDVIVTSNLFGDILSDEASVLTGSLAMLPSASIGGGRPGLYEPVHGSAPDIAGRGIANPCGAILCVALLLRHSLQMPEAADVVESGVAAVIEHGIVTPDLAVGAAAVDTRRMGDEVLASI